VPSPDHSRDLDKNMTKAKFLYFFMKMHNNYKDYISGDIQDGKNYYFAKWLHLSCGCVINSGLIEPMIVHAPSGIRCQFASSSRTRPL
jgi:hypothetical protein